MPDQNLVNHRRDDESPRPHPSQLTRDQRYLYQTNAWFKAMVDEAFMLLGVTLRGAEEVAAEMEKKRKELEKLLMRSTLRPLLTEDDLPL